MAGSAAEHEQPLVTVDFAGRPLSFGGDPDDPYFRSLEAVWASGEPLRRHLAGTLPPDAVCLDIGANIGLVSIPLALSCPQGMIYSFEASPRNAHHLRRNLALNGIVNCEVVEAAAGSREGRARFRQTAFAAASHIVAGNPDVAAPASTIVVPTLTIDRFRRERIGRPIDFIKVDVEGSEPEVLAGAAETIARDRCPIFMEFNSWCLLVYRNFNPLAFATAVLDAFDVARIGEDGAEIPAGGTVAEFLHRNLVAHGCVEDLLLRLKPDARLPPLDAMTKFGDDLANARELARLLREPADLVAPAVI